jgi:hypothetical protein
MYTLDVYSSVIWGGVIRSREILSRVSYPSEIDDNSFSEESFVALISQSQTDQSLNTNFTVPVVDPNSWLHGWNFTTDLYRMLEHALDKAHQHQPRAGDKLRSSQHFFLGGLPSSQSEILPKILSSYTNLPLHFKQTMAATSHTTQDIFSFQAANITATLQVCCPNFFLRG